MTRRTRPALVGAAVLALTAGSSLAGAATADETPKVVNREVVVADLDPSGKLDVARLLSQLSVTGKGTVSVDDPISTKGLRNLDGFGDPSVKDGKAHYTFEVDGSTTRRTLSDYDRALPVTIAATYRLDGKEVDPEDLVGESGFVEASYAVENVTATPTEITYKDGKGDDRTETVDLVTPLLGSLEIDLPKSYSALSTPTADVAGDGKGGSIVSYTMVLFEPIGDPTQTFTWSGQVKDAVLPPATLTVVPVATDNTSVARGEDSYTDGAGKAGDLTVGATQIDGHLLALQEGAGELLAGLTKLAQGAVDLRNGLKDQIAPGAAELSDGAAKAKTGTKELSSGLGDLSAGAGDLSAGMAEADTGAGALADGIAQILAGVEALPATLAEDADYQALLGALAAVKAGIGTASDLTPTTLLGGLNLLGYGLRSPLGVNGCDQTALPGTPTACGAADAVELVQTQLAAAAAAGGSLDQLVAAAKGAYQLSLCPAAPAGAAPIEGFLPPSALPDGTACDLLANLVYGLGLPAGILAPTDLGGVKAQTGRAATVLGAVFAGVDDSMLPGIAKLKAGLSNPACDLANPKDPANPCGVAQVQSLVSAGIGQLVEAVSAEIAGVLGLAGEGADALAEGTSLLAAGGEQLAAGAGKAAAGATELDEGLGKIADGAGRLSDGLDEATDGSGQIADGLAKAKAGDQQVVDGAARLRSEGTSKLVEGGNDTAAENARKAATLLAMKQRVADGALPYGAPEGATGSAAYKLTLAGVDNTGTENRNRAVAAVALLALATGAGSLIRRRFAG